MYMILLSIEEDNNENASLVDELWEKFSKWVNVLMENASLAKQHAMKKLSGV